MFEIKIDGLDKVIDKLQSVDAVSHDGLIKGVGAGLKQVQSTAKIHAPANDGYLRNSIETEVKAAKEIEGRVFTSLNYAVYVEFGTGPRGKESEKIVPSGVNLVYKDKGWLIPASLFPDYDKYGYKPIEIKGELFIPTRGQPAQQFMTPAGIKNRDTVPKIVNSIARAHIVKELKK